MAAAHRRIFHPPVERSPQRIGVNDGKDWSGKELNHFGVFFKYIDSFRTFFTQEPKVLGSEWDVWLTATGDHDQAVLENEQVWLVLEKLVSLHDPVLRDGNGDLEFILAHEILRLFGYIIPGRTTAKGRQTLLFTMWGNESCVAEFDIVVMNSAKTKILMGLQLDNKPDRHPRLNEIIPMAASIFIYNRKSNLGGPDYRERLVPIIIIYGSTPTFYLVPMTQQLVDDIAQGKSPSFETVVVVYEPIPKTNGLKFNLGMAQTDNRLPISQAYLAFKTFLDIDGSSNALRIDHILHSLEDGDTIQC